ncbi:MAG: radical SAM protein, partial [Desulfobulbaceae bacterium]|nr:radical SAM protein [Desulfobulbaceae bacterium]
MANMRKKAAYLKLHESGKLDRRIEQANSLLAECRICPHKCGVNRLEGELGLCRTGKKARVASYGPHFGEEAPLVGQHGSGALFFSGCNLLCVFCQNEEISHIDRQGDAAFDAMDSKQLAAIMLGLQKQGCHNINLVTPSHVVPQILSALPSAIEGGLKVPLVFNSSGYDAAGILKFLDGIVDIYMPDCKFWSREAATRYTRAKDYPEIMKQAVAEMHRQVGDLQMDENGIAVKGLLIRHLVMPAMVAETEGIARFLAETISSDTYINIMDQYRPCFKAEDFPEINRPLKRKEFEQAKEAAEKAGLHRFDERNWEKM